MMLQNVCNIITAILHYHNDIKLMEKRTSLMKYSKKWICLKKPGRGLSRTRVFWGHTDRWSVLRSLFPPTLAQADLLKQLENAKSLLPRNQLCQWLGEELHRPTKHTPYFNMSDGRLLMLFRRRYICIFWKHFMHYVKFSELNNA